MTQRLNEVDIIRLLLIFLLVGYHAFAPFCDAWKPITDTEIPLYWWIGKSFYACMLEAFVFISGYIYGYQCRIGRVKISTKQLLLKKAQRLMVPCVIFSFAYLCLFGLHEDETWVGAAYSIINGRGHMWFLPMLLCCFIATELLKRIEEKHSKKIIYILFAIAFIPVFELPLRMNIASHYLYFFYSGYLVQAKCLSLYVTSKLDAYKWFDDGKFKILPLIKA